MAELWWVIGKNNFKKWHLNPGEGGIGYQVADTGPVGWVNFWPRRDAV